MSFDDAVYMLELPSRNHLVVYDTRNTCDCLYRANTVDHVGGGAGDSVGDAVLSYAESLREMADEVEKRFFVDKGK